MPYVERDEAGGIKGVFRNLQPGYAEEWLDASDLPPDTPQRLREAAHAIDASNPTRPED